MKINNTAAIIFIWIALFKFSALKAQMVTEKFDKMDLSENFDSSNGMWTFMANNDNLFLVQEGEYILNRKTNVSPFAVIANYDNNLAAFRLVTSIKIERAADANGSVGIIFMAQADGQGGFVFEINTQKQYRLRQITASGYKHLTGEQKTGGWIKSSMINDLNVYNLLEIKTASRNYDIYLNNSYLMSFSEISYKTGRLGIVVGPGSKSKVDFMYLFSSSKYNDAEEKETSPEGKPTNVTTKESGGPDIVELAESIIKLKTQINKLTAENDDYKRTIDAIKSADDDAEKEKKNYEKRIKDMQNQMLQKDASVDSIAKINKELLKYKDMVAGNENSDLIISLSKSIKTEKEKNKILADSLTLLKTELIKQKTSSKNAKTNGSPNSNSENNKAPKDSTQQSKKDFVLPKEN